jgi:malate synthase
MDEILRALRRRSVGLNCGRWDYIFSWIKTLGAHPDRVLPDRADIGMTQPFLRAYTQQLVRVCHRRGAHAIGGMAAQIPIRDDPARNAVALAQVRADKEREVADGHDGTWVAHPALVPLARVAFDAVLTGPNQLDRLRPDAVFTEADLLATPSGHRTLAGLRHDVQVSVTYLEGWLRGIGCAPIDDHMEDAATAEISRGLVWQWLRHGVALDDGTPVDLDLVRRVITDEVGDRRGTGRFDEAADLFLQLCTSPDLISFLTIPAYDHLP